MRDTIHFRLGSEPRTLRNVDPTMTVLEYLRGPERLCGTKEGCAEGDCGACTVVLVDQQGRNQAVNACILFMPALDGRQLLTVEHLAGADGTLHPVQQAMVDQHGSQCGFCTPGFVMSLFALRAEARADRAAINEALAGNLCRCTGYRPIVDAALQACANDEPPCLAVGSDNDPEAVAATNTPLTLTYGDRRSFSPRSADELAHTLLNQPDAVIVAGATDVGLWVVTKQHQNLPVTVSLDAVNELRGIDEAADTIRIGAGVIYQDALPVLQRHYPDFGRADPPPRLPPDSQPRHHRRQPRQCLTDRRYIAGAAGVGRDGDPAARPGAAFGKAGRLLHRVSDNRAAAQRIHRTD